MLTAYVIALLGLALLYLAVRNYRKRRMERERRHQPWWRVPF